MAINKPTIAAGATYTRERAETVVVGLTSTIPPADRIAIIDGQWTRISQAPLREGQLLVHRHDGLRTGTLYVVIDIAGTLTWKQVKPFGDMQNPNTGKTYDSLAKLYDPLAS